MRNALNYSFRQYAIVETKVYIQNICNPELEFIHVIGYKHKYTVICPI